MTRIATACLLVSCGLACAAPPPEGRWEGVLDIPGRPIPLTIDLAQQAGSWSGSITMMGLGVRAPLADIVVTESTLRFAIANTLSTAEHGPAAFSARMADDGSPATIRGEFTQAGLRASFALRRTGVAQVDPPRRSTPIAAALEGTWIGEYELGGYPRRVTIKLVNAAGGATAEFVIVGKRTTNLPIDLVAQQGRYVRIESATTGIAFDGRLGANEREIVGTLQQGPFEPALTLRKAL